MSRVLLDEDVPEPLGAQLDGHQVESVRGMGWASIQNGELLSLAEAENFEVLITGDKGMKAQQRLAGRPFMTLVLSTIHWPTIKKNLPAIAQWLKNQVPGEVRSVSCGKFVRGLPKR